MVFSGNPMVLDNNSDLDIKSAINNKPSDSGHSNNQQLYIKYRSLFKRSICYRNTTYLFTGKLKIFLGFPVVSADDPCIYVVFIAIQLSLRWLYSCCEVHSCPGWPWYCFLGRWPNKILSLPLNCCVGRNPADEDVLKAEQIKNPNVCTVPFTRNFIFNFNTTRQKDDCGALVRKRDSLLLFIRDTWLWHVQEKACVLRQHVSKNYPVCLQVVYQAIWVINITLRPIHAFIFISESISAPAPSLIDFSPSSRLTCVQTRQLQTHSGCTGSQMHSKKGHSNTAGTPLLV